MKNMIYFFKVFILFVNNVVLFILFINLFIKLMIALNIKFVNVYLQVNL